MTPVIHYICSKCHFEFKRISAPDCCPNCGSTNVRESTNAMENTGSAKRPDVN